MNDQRFERDLRAVLAEDAPDVAPATLRVALQQVVAATRDRRGAVHRMGPVLSAVASFAVMGLILATVAVSWTGRAPGFGGAVDDRSPGPSPAFLWDSGIVVLAAGEARITAGGREYLVDPGPIAVHSDAGSETDQTLELEWREHDREMRLYFYFEADGEKWWLDRIQTRDGREPAEWLTYPGPLLSAPLGEPFTGDIERTSPDGQDGFSLEGMRLEAFRDGLIRQDPEGCQPTRPPRPSGDADRPAPEPGVVEDIDLSGMTPAEAAEWIAGRDLCVTWRFTYRTHEDDPAMMYSEYWCTPPDGEIFGGYIDESEGIATVMVRPVGNPVLEMRQQPPLGWGCG